MTPITIWAPNKSSEKFDEYEFTTENFSRDLTSDQVLLKGKGPKITIDISANVDELEIDNALIDEDFDARMVYENMNENVVAAANS